MADNVQLPGTGQTIATKDDGNGVEYQLVGAVDKSLQQVNPASSDEQSILKRMLMALLYPAWLDRSVNQIRSVVTGSVVVSSATLAANQDIRTVTTVTTVANQTNMDGYQGKMLPIGQNAAAWALCVRNRIT